MDNATFHKSNKSKALIEEKGAALLFLPPYSPDLNPIEQDFGALKKIRQYNHEKSIDDVIKYVSLIVQVTIENIIKAPLNKSVVPHLVYSSHNNSRGIAVLRRRAGWGNNSMRCIISS